jgi:putative tryptophan/tyrosine transport system substrate-binding protein
MLSKAQDGFSAGSMRRREFITLIGSATVAWPIAARAQQQLPVIGYLSAGEPGSSAFLVAAFRKGLSEAGFVEGKNVAIEFRWAGKQNDRLPALAAELVDDKVTAIVTVAGAAALLAAKAATTTIPVVFSTGLDPVETGLVASLNRPSGNMTGVSGLTSTIAPKRLSLMHQLFPSASRFALLVNDPASSNTAKMIADVQTAAAAAGRQIEVVTTNGNFDIDKGYTSLLQNRPDAILVSPEFIEYRAQLIMIAARYAMPAIYCFREDAEAGGLMSYGPSLTDDARLVGIYAARILKGDKPSDLPVIQAAKFQFIINLATARALRIDVPAELLVIADEVIE